MRLNFKSQGYQLHIPATTSLSRRAENACLAPFPTKLNDLASEFVITADIILRVA